MTDLYRYEIYLKLYSEVRSTESKKENSFSFVNFKEIISTAIENYNTKIKNKSKHYIFISGCTINDKVLKLNLDMDVSMTYPSRVLSDFYQELLNSDMGKYAVNGKLFRVSKPTDMQTSELSNLEALKLFTDLCFNEKYEGKAYILEQIKDLLLTL